MYPMGFYGEGGRVVHPRGLRPRDPPPLTLTGGGSTYTGFGLSPKTPYRWVCRASPDIMVLFCIT